MASTLPSVVLLRLLPDPVQIPPDVILHIPEFGVTVPHIPMIPQPADAADVVLDFDDHLSPHKYLAHLIFISGGIS